MIRFNVQFELVSGLNVTVTLAFEHMIFRMPVRVNVTIAFELASYRASVRILGILLARTYVRKPGRVGQVGQQGSYSLHVHACEMTGGTGVCGGWGRRALCAPYAIVCMPFYRGAHCCGASAQAGIYSAVDLKELRPVACATVSTANHIQCSHLLLR